MDWRKIFIEEIKGKYNNGNEGINIGYREQKTGRCDLQEQSSIKCVGHQITPCTYKGIEKVSLFQSILI